MKRFVLLFLAAVFAVGMSNLPLAAADGLKIGYLDVATVYDKYKKTQEADAVLEGQAKAKQAERNKMVAEITKMRDEMELLSEKGRADKQAIIDEKIKKLQEFDKAARVDLARQRDTKVAEIFKDIDTVVQDYGSKSGLDLIFNAQTLVFKKGAFNVTEDILKALNSGSGANKTGSGKDK